MPLSWGDAIVCINIKDSFLYCDSGFIHVHAFRIGSFLSLRASLDTAGTDYIQSSRWNIDTDQVIVLYQGDRSPRKPPGIHVRSPGLGSLRRNDRR